MTSLATIRTEALRALMPPPKLRLSEWLEREIRLPEGVSYLSGPMRLWPYQHEIADAISDPSIERVTVVKPVRVGFTTLLTGALASYVVNDPAPILVLLPTESDCRDYVVSDIEPTFEASPALRGMLDDDSDEGRRNTMMSRRFPGGSLKVVAAKSQKNLRRHTARVLFIDEADGMLPGPEGSSPLLAERRTLSYADRKIVLGSTPVDLETSTVLRAYEKSDKRIFEVPCPECGEFHEIRWQDIRWPEGHPEAAHYVCPHCGSVVEEKHKPKMIGAGRWRAQAPEVTGHAGFRLNALVSLLENASWGKLAIEFVQAKNDPDALHVFVNTILAEGWAESAGEVDEQTLIERVEPFDIEHMPEEVLVITAGCDVQDDRIEVTLVGWDAGGSAYILHHHIVFGTPDENQTWIDLDHFLAQRWKHPFGGSISVDAAVVDSGDGDWTTTVYGFSFPRYRRKILAGKGMPGSRPALEMSKSKTRGGHLFLIGVDGIKTTIFNRIERNAALRFSDSLNLAWFEQLTSEHRVIRYHRGQPRPVFERKQGRRAEALDCTVYAFAARHAVTINFDVRAAELRLEQQPSPRPKEIRSSWLDR